MNLSSLSSQLNMSIQDLRAKAKEKGIFISDRANKIDNFVARQIMEALAEKQKAPVNAGPVINKKVKLPSFIKVRDFAALLNLPVTTVIKELIKNGIMATINQEVDFDTATIVAQDLNFEVETQADTASTEFGLGFLQEVLAAEKEESLKPRRPLWQLWDTLTTEKPHCLILFAKPKWPKAKVAALPSILALTA